jgi:hypothetical protein
MAHFAAYKPWIAKKMKLYKASRLASAEGMQQRKTAPHFAISCRRICKMLAFSVLPGYAHKAVVTKPEIMRFAHTLKGLQSA